MPNLIIRGLAALNLVWNTRMSAAASALGLSSLQARILHELSETSETISVGECARRFRVSAATISDSVRVLAEKGLVIKRRAHDDARSVVISLSERGRGITSSTSDWLQEFQGSIDRWDDAKLEQIRQSLVELIEALDGGRVLEHGCRNCQHLAVNCDIIADSAPHFCRCYHVLLRDDELRTDCPDFVESDRH